MITSINEAQMFASGYSKDAFQTSKQTWLQKQLREENNNPVSRIDFKEDRGFVSVIDRELRELQRVILRQQKPAE